MDRQGEMEEETDAVERMGKFREREKKTEGIGGAV